MAGHSEGVKVSEFCALRTEKCPCGNEYQKNCTPAPVGWGMFTFVQGRKKRVDKKFEAHHLLCVACVTEFLAKKPAIVPVVEQTKWCINATTNLFAMPLWGHTIQWYCNLAGGGIFNMSDTMPPFQNIPMHDYDHNSEKGYKFEIDRDMKKLAKQIEEKQEENHEAAVKELKAQLVALSNKWRATLQTRGASRSGGTHAAWYLGMREPQSKWYLPFSMADDANAEERTFPATGLDPGKLAEKIQRLVDALTKWS